MRDLVVVAEGNETVFENGLINFEKVQLVGKLILEVQRLQKSEYRLDINPSQMMISYIKHLNGEEEARLDELSLLCEPAQTPILSPTDSPPQSPNKATSHRAISPRPNSRRGGEELIVSYEAAYFPQGK